MDAELSPSQLRLARQSLFEIEQLTRKISHPFAGELNYIAKGLFGLLSLYLTSPALRMDFRALMTLSGITREGAFDKKGERLRDPDRSKRKTLRAAVKSLIKVDLLKNESVDYGVRLAQTEVLEHIPDEGVICWAGGLLHIKNRPIGQKTSVFAFEMPEAKIINWLEVQRILPTAFDPSRIEICRNQLKLTLNLLDDLLQKNKITAAEVTTKHKQLTNEPGMIQVRCLTYLLSACEKTRGMRKRLLAIPPLLAKGNVEKYN